MRERERGREKWYCEWQEIASGVAFGRGDGGQDFGLVHAHNDGAISEASDLASLEGDESRANLEFLSECLEDLGACDDQVRVGLRLGGEAEATAANGAEAEGPPCEEVWNVGEERVGSSRHGRHGF